MAPLPGKMTPTQAALGSRALTATTLCCSSLQSLGRMGRMVGGSRMPSSMWMTPLAASTPTLRRGTPSGPSRMRPCGGAQHASLAQSPPLHSAHCQRPSLPATSSPAPWQHLLLWQNRSSLCTLTHVVSATRSPLPLPMCSPSSSLEPSQLVGPQERDLICACSHMTPHQGMPTAGLGAQSQVRKRLDTWLVITSPSTSPSLVLMELTSSEIFTARTWFAMVRTRPLEMSFSTVSWGGGESGLRPGTSQPWGHTQSCPGDSQLPPWSPGSPLSCRVRMGGERRRGPPRRLESADKPSDSPLAGVSQPPSQRTSHLAVAIDMVPHQLLQFGETLAEERGLGC